MNNPNTGNEIRMDAANLFLEEVFTDNTVGTLRRLTPVTPDRRTRPGPQRSVYRLDPGHDDRRPPAAIIRNRGRDAGRGGRGIWPCGPRRI